MIFPLDEYNMWHLSEVTNKKLLPLCQEGAQWGYQQGMFVQLRVQKDEIETAIKDLRTALEMIVGDEGYEITSDDKAQAMRALGYSEAILAKYA